MACEKCWNDAYVRARTLGGHQADHYRRLLEERKDVPCAPEGETDELTGAFPHTSARYPLRIHCAACGLRILVVLNRNRDVALAMDPEPDGDGEHFDTILAEDLSYAVGSTDSAEMLADWKGRFQLYRCHAWTCPERLAVPRGRDVPRIGGYWRRED